MTKCIYWYVDCNKNAPPRATWFGKCAATNAGKLFLDLLYKHFTKYHYLSKLNHINKLKLSYCRNKNLERIISSHNSKILKAQNINFREGVEKCSLDGNGLADKIIDQTCQSKRPGWWNQKNVYQCNGRNHNQSFSYKKNENSTLFSHVIRLIKIIPTYPKILTYPKIEKMVNRKESASIYGDNVGCRLCLEEKLRILEFRHK